MKIRLSQSGGFAGVPIELANIDTRSVSPTRAKRLEELVDKAVDAKLFADRATAKRGVGADNDVTYTITVSGTRNQTVSFADNGNGLTRSVPDGLAQLVREVVGDDADRA